MSFEVLLTRSQNQDARAELQRRSLHFVSSLPKRALRKLGVLDSANVGDIHKSWDVLKTTEFIETNIPKDGCIVDLGACGSELLYILSRLGYQNLVGIDVNHRMLSMPKSVRYVLGDFMKLPFCAASFEVVTAISVIEHGFRADPLLTELARVVKPGGYFVASVDYWPQKIETQGLQEYGMDWLIFSQAELGKFLEKAATYGFESLGPISWDADEKTVRWMGKEYTFAWLVLQRKRPAQERIRSV